MAGYTYLIHDSALLAQGSAPAFGARLPFDTIVLAAKEYQPRLPGYETIHMPLDDGPEPDPITQAQIRATAHAVAQRVRAGRRVLVTCWMGRNRSGVISALALVELGLSCERAVRRIMRLRKGLTNPHFVEMVRRSCSTA